MVTKRRNWLYLAQIATPGYRCRARCKCGRPVTTRRKNQICTMCFYAVTWPPVLEFETWV